MRWRWILVVICLAIVAIMSVFFIHQTKSERKIIMGSSSDLQLTSQSFANNQVMPQKYSCKGQNISPPLTIHNVPSSAKSLALIMHDPDAPSGDYLHWTVWNIPISSEQWPENTVPNGAVQGNNDNDNEGYMGPCPPKGAHRYHFDLFALDSNLSLPTGSSRQQLQQAMQKHIVSQTTLTGLFSTD